MEEQKSRSRNASQLETGDWVELQHSEGEGFIGYDHLEADVRINRYRKVKGKKGEFFQFVFNYTPFYAESGGQVGDTGYIQTNGEKIEIFNTVKENNLTVHLSKELPSDPTSHFKAVVDKTKRRRTAVNHTATHLLDHALREILGTHIEQKGSLVNADYLRFDCSHFKKVTDEELLQIQHRVNQLIREDLPKEENREIPIQEAQQMGAIALFGEKYGDLVRVIKFGESIELCGGTHLEATGQIGSFIIISEGSISAGVRRIEAITGEKAEEYIDENLRALKEVSGLFNNPSDLKGAVTDLQSKLATALKQVEAFEKEEAGKLKKELISQLEPINGVNFLARKLDIGNSAILKDIAFQLKGEIENLFLVLAADIEGKANVHVMISDNLVKE
jgi:alanyl-tRNA synthetase